MRWYVVDDHAVFRAAAQALLESVAHDVVGTSDGTDRADVTVETIRNSGAEAVLLDINLPTSDGFEIADELAAEAPDIRCVLTSTRPRSTYEHRLGESAAVRFVSKTELSPASLAEALL